MAFSATLPPVAPRASNGARSSVSPSIRSPPPYHDGQSILDFPVYWLRSLAGR